MDRLIKIAKALALLSVVPVAVFICIFLHQLTATTAELQTTAKAVNTTVQTLPGQVDSRLASIQSDVLNKIDTVQNKLTAEVNGLADKSDVRLASVQSDLVSSVNTQLAEANKNLNDQLTETNKSISLLASTYAAVPSQVAAQYNKDFDPFFNCKQNALCLQGQASDTMFALRTTSRDASATFMGIQTTLPKLEDNALTVTNTIATSTPLIVKNFADITTNINSFTKPKWYDRLLGYALQGAIIYRNVNPVTSVTISGAQVAAGAILGSGK